MFRPLPDGYENCFSLNWIVQMFQAHESKDHSQEGIIILEI